MSKIFDIDFRNGSRLPKPYRGSISDQENQSFQVREKGMTYIAKAIWLDGYYNSHNYLDDITISETVTTVLAFKVTNDGYAEYHGGISVSQIVKSLIQIDASDNNNLKVYGFASKQSGYVGMYNCKYATIKKGYSYLAINTFDGTNHNFYVNNIEYTNTINVGNYARNNRFALFTDTYMSIQTPITEIYYAHIYDTVLTTTERNKLYVEFLNSKHRIENKRNFTYPKPTDLSSESGLVAAYNMIPSNGQLIDISGNGNNGTINGALSTKDGMKFDGVDDYVIFGSAVDAGVNNGISFRFKYTDAISSTQYFFGGTPVSQGFRYDGTSLLLILDLFTAQVNVSLDVGKTYTITLARSGTAVVVYLNGSLIDTLTNVRWTSSTEIRYIGRRADRFYLNAEYQDFRIYNFCPTSQQAKDYHNSFVKPVLIDTLSDTGADGVVKTPRDWIKGTGEYTVEEEVIEQGELVTNGTFDTDSDWNKNTGWTISGGTANASNSSSNVNQIGVMTVGKRYKVKFDITSYTSGSIVIQAGISGQMSDSYNSVGSYSVDLSANGSDGRILLTGTSFTGSIDNVSVVEIPPLPDFGTEQDYLECDTAGTTAKQSKQAHGTWEFDMYKGADGNQSLIPFITNLPSNSSSNNRYAIWINNSEIIYLLIKGGALFTTPASYIKNNTWYRIKVARLASEGVFKDIDTLQVSDLVQSATQQYTTFTSNGRYGFTATSDGSGIMRAGTVDEILIVNTEKYLIEFDAKLNSGTAPGMWFKSSIGGTTLSNQVQLVDGKNSYILTATGTDTGVLEFFNSSTTTDYEISGLTIRRIYPADTFAVFIKGGAFGDTYQLVDTTGGSGSNPVTDSTYKTSEFFVADLDAGDRLTNIKLYNGVKQ